MYFRFPVWIKAEAGLAEVTAIAFVAKSAFVWCTGFAVYIAFEKSAHALDFFGVFRVRILGLAGVVLEVEQEAGIVFPVVFQSEVL